MNTVLEPSVSSKRAKAHLSRKLIAPNVRPKKIADLIKGKEIKLNVTYGADPELGIFSLEQNRIVSSIPILKRDKHFPIDLGDGIACYADSVLIETSFKPSKTADEMLSRMKTAFGRMQELIGPKYRLGTQAAHMYEAEELQVFHTDRAAPFEKIDPNLVGCDPSFSAIDGTTEKLPKFNDGMRSGSFHIHLGSKDLVGGQSYQRRINLVRLMDLFVAIPSVIFDKDPTNAWRRQRYGRASSYRKPPHGLEYRVISCSPLASREMTALILDLTQYACEQMRKGKAAEIINAIKPDDVKTAINTCDVKLARKILSVIGLPSDLMARVEQDYGKPNLYQTWGL